MLSLIAFSTALATLVGAVAGPAADHPVLLWQYEALSNLYAPPLAAEMVTESPGLETVICASEARRLICLDAKGAMLWEFAGGWTKRMPASPAYTAATSPPSILAANSDGALACVDAATGSLRWEQRPGGITWGSVLWADLTGDGLPEAIAGTENDGLHAYTADGDTLWSWFDSKRNTHIDCPIAAVDVTGDGKAELFAVTGTGPVRINSDGKLAWRAETGDTFLSAATVADANWDGAPELYCASNGDNLLYAFDARGGDIRWARPLLGPSDVYPGSAICVGDILGHEAQEILAGDMRGRVYCFSAAGELLWVFQAAKQTHIAPVLADVDGDGAVDVLAASGDHFLYCLDHAGRLKWRYEADLRLVSPPTVSDLNQDGRADILLCGSDGILRCLTLGGRIAQERLPWPSRRFDPEQTGASFGKRAPEARVSETVDLLVNGDFELARDTSDAPAGTPAAQRAKEPAGWTGAPESRGAWRRDTDTRHGGKASLLVEAKEAPCVVRSEPIAVPPQAQKIRAEVWCAGNGMAALEWVGQEGPFRRDQLEATPDTDGEWTRHEAWLLAPPWQAEWVVLEMRAAAGAPVRFDDARLSVEMRSAREATPLVNQVGYDVGAPKRFTTQSNFVAKEASFELIDGDGKNVHSGALEHRGRITGAYGHDWGHEYWRGDFTGFDTPGRYRIRVSLDGVTGESWPFDIGDHLLWENTARPAYRFFYYQRCGQEVPGYHGPCHLDDAIAPDGTQLSLAGGWHDAGDYNKYHNAPYVYGVANAYVAARDAFDAQDTDGNGVSDILDEILWGGDYSRRMIADDGSARGALTSGYGFWGPPERETDNLPGTGDERPVEALSGVDSSNQLAAVARIARLIDGDKTPWVEAAKRALEWALANEKRGPMQFSAALDLYVATNDEQYAALAREMIPAPAPETAGMLRLFDERFGEDHSAALRDTLVAQANELLKQAENPFGVYTFGPAKKPNFFGTPPAGVGWHVGTSSHILNAANTALLAYQYEPDPRYLAFAYDQLNWTLGNNPFDLSLMEACGDAFLPSYHQRLTFAGVPRGAIPGSVVNGVTWRAPGDDRPFVDLSGVDIPAFEPNEVWLPHNTAYLNVIANLRTAGGNKVAQADKPDSDMEE